MRFSRHIRGRPLCGIVVSALLVISTVAVGLSGALQPESGGEAEIDPTLQTIAKIRDVTIINKVDRDGDGYYSDFGLRIQADTDCYGCYDKDGPFSDAEAEYFLSVSLDGYMIGRTPELPHDDYLAWDIYPTQSELEEHDIQRGRVSLTVYLKDDDTPLDEGIDSWETIIPYEPTYEDLDEGTDSGSTTALPPRTTTASPSTVDDGTTTAATRTQIQTTTVSSLQPNQTVTGLNLTVTNATVSYHTATIVYTITNTNTTPLSGVMLTLSDLPPEWAVVNQSAEDGNWAPATRTWFWPHIAPNSTKTVSVTITGPTDTPAQPYTISATATDSTNHTNTETISVRDGTLVTTTPGTTTGATTTITVTATAVRQTAKS